MNDAETILEIRSLTKIYPGTVALENANIRFQRGKVHGIIGKNGAGKSTLVTILSGIIPPSTGQIIIKGKEYSHLTPLRAKHAGIGICTQKPETIPDFSLVQNLFLPAYEQNRLGLLKWKHMQDHTQQIFDQAGFHIDIDRKMRDLTLSEQQIFLALKAFFLENSDIVILDEITTSFSQREQDFFYQLIREQKLLGKSIIFISHRMDEILEICDRITVLRDARVVETVERTSADKDRLCSMIVGESYCAPALTAQEAAQSSFLDQIPVLNVGELTREGSFEDIHFEVHRGEILGLAGLVGSGRTEILKAIAGIDTAQKGFIQIEGKEKKRFSKSWDALDAGIVYLTEDRDDEGVINVLSVRKNLSLSFLVRIARRFLLQNTQERTLVQNLIRDFGILTSSTEEEVQNLSGGNRQKVLCGRVASTQAKAFLLDEPTKGIDIAAKESILKSIKEKLALNAGVVITSPGIDDLLTVCDRIIVLFEGRAIRSFQRSEFNELEIYRSVQGLVSNAQTRS
jgi:ABC-type sugar transport system ATPase subunit